MIQPYKIIEETSDSTTYVYNTWYTWTFYFLLVVWFLSFVMGKTAIYLAATAGVLLYFFLKLFLGRQVSARIKDALKNSSVNLSGSKHSLRNPLTIVVPSEE